MHKALYAWLKRQRLLITRLLTVLILSGLVYWGVKHRIAIQQAFMAMHIIKLFSLFLLIMIGLIFATWSFTYLVRAMGYRFRYSDGYHSLNLTQMASMAPGRIWGLAGLAGLLLSRGITKTDSALIIFLNTLLMLTAAVSVGVGGLIPAIGWKYTAVCFLPMATLICCRSWIEKWHGWFSTGKVHLPTNGHILVVFLMGVLSWIAISVSFALTVYYSNKETWPMSPWLIASSFSAGYIGGFLSIFTPSGLGVREGIIAFLLGTVLTSEKALTLAIIYRVIHMAVLWINISVTLIVLFFRKEKHFLSSNFNKENRNNMKK
ncbi:MAG: lysylphosphatidylglycerol synthase domain-containing protein [Pseudomonadota bacterium]